MISSLIRRQTIVTEVVPEFDIDEVKTFKHVHHVCSEGTDAGVFVLVNYGMFGYYPGDVIKLSSLGKPFDYYSTSLTFKIVGIGMANSGRVILVGKPISPAQPQYVNRVVFMIDNASTMSEIFRGEVHVLSRARAKDMEKCRQINPNECRSKFLEILKDRGLR